MNMERSCLFLTLTTGDADEIEGLYIELWVIIWTLLNVFFLVIMAKSSFWLIWGLLTLIVIIRLADSFYAFLIKMFKLVTIQQRSFSRSYTLLFFVFFEMAAMFSSIQIFIYKIFCKCDLPSCMSIDWGKIYYNTLLSMVTIGGNHLPGCSPTSVMLLSIVQIAKPIFSVLLVTLAINQILAYSKPS